MPAREISLPFRLDSQGLVASTVDPNASGRQHLTSYLMTRPGERVMRPVFGTRVRDFVFENLDPLQVSLLVQAVSDRVSTDVPDVVLQNVTADDSDTATLALTVSFALNIGAGQGQTQTLSLTPGGSTS